jgi:hypothetical protein
LQWFMTELLGRDSPVGRLYQSKMEEHLSVTPALPSLRSPSSASSSLLSGTLASCALFAIITSFLTVVIVLSQRQSADWQLCLIWITLFAMLIEVAVCQTAECWWMHVMLPMFARPQVLSILLLVRDAIIEAFLDQQHQQGRTRGGRGVRSDRSRLDFTAYLFASKRVAEDYPVLIESILVQRYESSMPTVQISRSWQVPSSPYSLVERLCALPHAVYFALTRLLTVAMMVLIFSAITTTPAYLAIVAAILLIAALALYVRHRYSPDEDLILPTDVIEDTLAGVYDDVEGRRKIPIQDGDDESTNAGVSLGVDDDSSLSGDDGKADEDQNGAATRNGGPKGHEDRYQSGNHVIRDDNDSDHDSDSSGDSGAMYRDFEMMVKTEAKGITQGTAALHEPDSTRWRNSFRAVQSQSGSAITLPVPASINTGTDDRHIDIALPPVADSDSDISQLSELDPDELDFDVVSDIVSVSSGEGDHKLV